MLVSKDTMPADLDTATIRMLSLNVEASKQRISLKTIAPGQGFLLFSKRALDLKLTIHCLEGIHMYEYLEGNQFVGLIHQN